MKSYEVIREAVEEPGVKAVAAALKVSAALVYKWSNPPEADDPDASGTKNPLDRVRELYEITRDIRLIRWLCHAADGFFVANPHPDPRHSPDREIFLQTRRMFREFSELLDAVTASVENDGSVDTAEAARIRLRWEDLKSSLERFVLSCESGDYQK
jgi:hypothetical protein